MRGLLPLLMVACVGKRAVEEVPRWMTEKQAVRLEIIDTLLDAQESGRAMELIRTMREERYESPQLDLLQGKALRQQGMTEDAERLLKRSLADDGKNSETHRELCVLYADQDRMPEAVASCRRSTELDPRDAGAWNNYGFLLLAQGESAVDARTALEKAVDLKPTEPKYRNNLAFAQVASGDHRSALKTFLTTGTPADAHYNVGTAFERAGDETTALTYYRRALKMDAQHLHADEAVKRLASNQEH